MRRIRIRGWNSIGSGSVQSDSVIVVERRRVRRDVGGDFGVKAFDRRRRGSRAGRAPSRFNRRLGLEILPKMKIFFLLFFLESAAADVSGADIVDDAIDGADVVDRFFLRRRDAVGSDAIDAFLD